MNTVLRIGFGILIVIALVLAGLAVGWVLWGRGLWTGWGYRMGPGMTRGWDGPAAPCSASGSGAGCGGNPVELDDSPPASSALTIEGAYEAVEGYIDALGYPDMETTEIMEFEYNYYAIVEEANTGIGAMELLVDKWTGKVGPEMGPNMMWNSKYGMHGRGGMMGRTRGANTLTADEAQEIAQRWLDTNRPGVTIEEHADPFYGYYTIHTLRDGEIEGMLSVHGSTGQVWYHAWHGAFVQMLEVKEQH
jgi:hypothetical protein